VSDEAAKTIQALYSRRDVPIDIDALLPADLGEWPVSRPLARWLARLIVHHQRRRVLEFGAGWSSVVLARALAECRAGQLTSVEHQPEYLADCWQKVEQTSIDAALVVASLHRKLSRHGVLWHYRNISKALASRAPFDLVLIDAPPGRFGRASPLHDVFRLLTKDAVVVLDDAARPREQTAIRQWQTTYPGLELVLLDRDTADGVAVFRHDGTGRRRIAWRAAAWNVREQWRERRRR